MPACSHLCRRSGVDGDGIDNCSQRGTMTPTQDGHTRQWCWREAEAFRGSGRGPILLLLIPNQNSEEDSRYSLKVLPA